MEDPLEGCHCLWFPQRAMDAQAYSPRDQARIQRSSSSFSCLENTAPRRLELSGARAPCDPKGRRSHRTLEALQVACYKKKPEDLVPTSFSSMKAAFCSFRRDVEHGDFKAKRPSSVTAISTKRSRHWRRSPFRPNANTSVCTLVFSRTISRHSMWPTFFALSCEICVATSFSCGTTLRFTRDRT